MKEITDRYIIPTPALRDNVLEVLEKRAELEIRRESTIDQAITTLKISLELRKSMLENIMFSLGGKNTSQKKKLLRHVPDSVICTTSRSLLMLSRCFLQKEKFKCAQRARRDAEALFQSNRIIL
jgi:uracil DNA glycosylase